LQCGGIITDIELKRSDALALSSQNIEVCFLNPIEVIPALVGAMLQV
jgi:short-subunit dehydrogenase involved in D-alanine esterification of teichoic acids